jgi:hypothetical protein
VSNGAVFCCRLATSSMIGLLTAKRKADPDER